MKKISDIFNSQKRTISFELFPPKTPEGELKLFQTIEKLALLKPDFFSCTYGAGGSSRGKTLDIVSHIQEQHHIPAMAHLTCVMHTKSEIKNILDDMRARQIHNVLALRGDPPKDNPDYKAGPENFVYSSDLIAFIRNNFGQEFTIAAAGFPEGHILAPNKEFDAGILKNKIDKGADFIITQLFFNNQEYYDYIARLKSLGVSARVIPGILPITDYNALLRFCALCGTSVPEEIHTIFKPLVNDPDATLAAGIAFAVKQCQDLLAHDAPGLHFYTLNKVSPTDKILKAIQFKT